MFEFSSDEFSGEIWIGSVGQSGGMLKESLQYRYVCVDGCPVFVNYSECFFAVGQYLVTKVGLVFSTGVGLCVLLDALRIMDSLSRT